MTLARRDFIAAKDSRPCIPKIGSDMMKLPVLENDILIIVVEAIVKCIEIECPSDYHIDQ